MATGVTANERMTAIKCGSDSDAALGLAFNRLSPSSGSAHWNSWNGAWVSWMPEPVRKTSQRRMNTSHYSIETPHRLWADQVSGLEASGTVSARVHGLSIKQWRVLLLRPQF